jgi:hypothetical protein
VLVLVLAAGDAADTAPLGVQSDSRWTILGRATAGGPY